MTTTPDINTGIRYALENFISKVEAELDTHEVERLLRGKTTLTSIDIGNQPEPWTEDNLIWPILSELGLNKDPQPYGGGDRPDFELLNIDEPVIGESKSPNKIDEAEDDITGYLRDKAFSADYGIATDGLDWRLIKIELGGDFLQVSTVKQATLRNVLSAIAANRGIISDGAGEVDVEEELQNFINIFEKDRFQALVTEEIPQELRIKRKRSVSEFYDLYIKLLFGDGEGYQYDISLLDDIITPRGTPEKDKRIFAVTLVNRLLFIKFLEEKNLLDDGFLRNRVEVYQNAGDKIAGNLYESQIKPLFYELLNKKKEDRDPKYRQKDTWFNNVDYLNGGLFRPNVDDERKYRVRDRILPIIISDLIEGTALETTKDGLDPSIIGSVFEKTINHLEQERDQKDIGAYYTPNDVTALITRKTIDPKLKKAILTGYAEAVSLDEETFTESNEKKTLEEILRNIEESRGWFGSPEGIESALEKISNITILDLACGSGHFLTTAFDEIHRAQQSLLRGLHGPNLDPKKIYEKKKQLALNSIYGVDIEPVGCEIAKLRVWLKMIEDGWDEDKGKLPNIDVNIAAGNSLIGLPTTGGRQGTLDDDKIKEQIREISTLRKKYKFEDTLDKKEAEEILNKKVRPRLNELFIQQENYAVSTEINTVEEFKQVVQSLPEDRLYPSLQSIKTKPTHRGSISEKETELLNEYGFTTYTKSARLNINNRAQELRQKRNDSIARDQIIDELTDLLQSGFDFVEVERQPIEADLCNVQGKPFHWIAEFPEIADLDEMGLEFDIILGNPPYGDILDDSEKVLTKGYKTGGISDVSAPFVERQLQLLGSKGFFGNITTLRLVYQSDIEEYHQLLMDSLSNIQISCFGFRPSKIFQNAHIDVGITVGRVDRSDMSPIHTSDYILFNTDNRQERLNNIEYGEASSHILRNKIGGHGGNRAILPKVGSDMKISILKNLKQKSRHEDFEILSELYERNETDIPGESYVVWKRRGALYWINPMLEELYSGSEVKPMYFDNKLHQQAAFIIMQSSLYYVYWLTYSNLHHHNWSHLKPFPIPSKEKLSEYSERINNLSTDLWEEMKGTFTKSRESRGDFHMRSVKPKVDEVDELLSELYDLTDDQLQFVQNYITDLGEGSGRRASIDADVNLEEY
jgi:hypothetical protein